MKQNKEKTIGFRITHKEYEKMKEYAFYFGFDTISSFILWVWRKFKKDNAITQEQQDN